MYEWICIKLSLKLVQNKVTVIDVDGALRMRPILNCNSHQNHIVLSFKSKCLTSSWPLQMVFVLCSGQQNVRNAFVLSVQTYKNRSDFYARVAEQSNKLPKILILFQLYSIFERTRKVYFCFYYQIKRNRPKYVRLWWPDLFIYSFLNLGLLNSIKVKQ